MLIIKYLALILAFAALVLYCFAALLYQFTAFWIIAPVCFLFSYIQMVRVSRGPEVKRSVLVVLVTAPPAFLATGIMLRIGGINDFGALGLVIVYWLIGSIILLLNASILIWIGRSKR